MNPLLTIARPLNPPWDPAIGGTLDVAAPSPSELR